MNQTLSVAIYVSLVGAALVLWKFTKPLSIGKRWSIFGCFAWLVFLLSVDSLYSHWVWYYGMHNAEHFMREVATEQKWFGENSAERDEIIGLAFTHPKTMAESADNVRRALEKARSNSVVQPSQKSSKEVHQ